MRTAPCRNAGCFLNIQQIFSKLLHRYLVFINQMVYTFYKVRLIILRFLPSRFFYLLEKQEDICIAFQKCEYKGGEKYDSLLVLEFLRVLPVQMELGFLTGINLLEN